MLPFDLTTERLLLDRPAERDVDDIARFCTDPLFERFMVTPWPYERRHAEFFVDGFVPNGWRRDAEWTWAIRRGSGAPLLGVVGVRLDTGMVGYWLGAPHRGSGLMAEALSAAVDAVFARTDRDVVLWECRLGNTASARVAAKAGFRCTGRRPGLVPQRDGGPSESLTGVLHRSDDRAPKAGWPEPA